MISKLIVSLAFVCVVGCGDVVNVYQTIVRSDDVAVVEAVDAAPLVGDDVEVRGVDVGQLEAADIEDDSAPSEVLGPNLPDGLDTAPDVPDGADAAPVCGDGACEAGEDSCSCPGDCHDDPWACSACECGGYGGEQDGAWTCACDPECVGAGDCCANACKGCGLMGCP